MRAKTEIEDGHVSYDIGPETQREVFWKLLGFFIEQGLFTGECIMQSDSPSLDGPELLSEIADDIMKFEVEWDE